MKHPRAICQNKMQVIDYMWRHYVEGVYKYSFWSMVFVVLGQFRTVASPANKHPSYAWCEFIQEEGELQVQIDRGRLPHYVRAWDHKKGGHSDRRYMINTLVHWLENATAFEMISGEDDTEENKVRWMLENGIALHQPFLVVCRFGSGYYSTQDGDDYDEDMDCEILFVDQEPMTLFLPLVGNSPSQG